MRSLRCTGSPAQKSMYTSFMVNTCRPGSQPRDTGKREQSLFCCKWAQKTSVSWRINSSSHPPINVIVTSRCPSFMKMACQSFFPPSHTDDKNTHINICAGALPMSWAAEFLIGCIPLTSHTQGSWTDILTLHTKHTILLQWWQENSPLYSPVILSLQTLVISIFAAIKIFFNQLPD